MIDLIYNVRTGFLLSGFLFVLMPVLTWIVLKNQKSQSVYYWCSGGVFLGIGLLFVGLRGRIPDWISYPLANGLLFLGNVFHVQALAIEIHKPFSKITVFLAWCGISLGYYFIWTIDVGSYVRFFWSVSFLILLVWGTTWLAGIIAFQERNKGARWLAFIYAMITLFLLIRLLRLLFGLTNAEAVEATIDAVLTTVSAVLMAVIGNVAVIGMYVERMNQQNLVLIGQKERQAILMELSEKIADLERYRSMAEMSAGLAHELGQPISSLMMDIYVLENRYHQLGFIDGVADNALDSIRKNVERANGILTGISQYIKYRKTETSLVQITSVIENVMALIFLSDRKNKPIYCISPDLNSITIHANSVQLAQVFMNIFRNAIEAKAEDRLLLIEVGVRQGKKEICIFVDDDGQGLTLEEQSSIGQFNYTTKPDGMGVGLVICKRIVELHGGRLVVAPSPILRGVRIELYLPNCILVDAVG